LGDVSGADAGERAGVCTGFGDSRGRTVAVIAAAKDMCAGCGSGGSGAGVADRGPGDGARCKKLGTLGIGRGIAPAEVGERDRVTSVGRPGLGEAMAS
jgi:hypothetical protein